MKHTTSKADRLAAVHVVHCTTNRLDHSVPGYLLSWIETGMGHGLNHAAQVICDLRVRTTRLTLCEALEMLGGDGHRFIHGDGKNAPIAVVSGALRRHVRWLEEQARDDGARMQRNGT